MALPWEDGDILFDSYEDDELASKQQLSYARKWNRASSTHSSFVKRDGNKLLRDGKILYEGKWDWWCSHPEGVIIRTGNRFNFYNGDRYENAEVDEGVAPTKKTLDDVRESFEHERKYIEEAERQAKDREDNDPCKRSDEFELNEGQEVTMELYENAVERIEELKRDNDALQLRNDELEEDTELCVKCNKPVHDPEATEFDGDIYCRPCAGLDEPKPRKIPSPGREPKKKGGAPWDFLAPMIIAAVFVFGLIGFLVWTTSWGDAEAVAAAEKAPLELKELVQYQGSFIRDYWDDELVIQVEHESEKHYLFLKKDLYWFFKRQNWIDIFAYRKWRKGQRELNKTLEKEAEGGLINTMVVAALKKELDDTKAKLSVAEKALGKTKEELQQALATNKQLIGERNALATHRDALINHGKQVQKSTKRKPHEYSRVKDLPAGVIVQRYCRYAGAYGRYVYVLLIQSYEKNASTRACYVTKKLLDSVKVGDPVPPIKYDAQLFELEKENPKELDEY